MGQEENQVHRRSHPIYEAFRRIVKQVNSQFAGLPEISYSLAFDDTYIVLTSKHRDEYAHVERICWEDIERIYGYKKGCATVDQIRMELLDKSDKGILITEDMQGWEGMVKALPLRLPGCREFDEWFSIVAVPAFEQNMTLLYERKGKKAESA